MMLGPITLHINGPLLQTFAAVLLAHVVADFILQPGWMVARKRSPPVLLLHVGVVFALTTAALGGIWQFALFIALAHLIIDMLKVYALPHVLRDSLGAFLADQGLHLVSLLWLAALWPGTAAIGLLGPWMQTLTPWMLGLSGLIITVFAGGFAVGLITRRFSGQIAQQGMSDAGRIIGNLERALIFLLVMINQPAGIGFLITAKSILRFDTAREDQKLSEYVIIGTLASFGWGLVAALATRSLLEIAAGTP
jgi:hypothetical protein